MLEQRVLEFFTRVCPTQPDDTLLVSVSGGPDSVALLHLLLRVRDNLGVSLEVAHMDHGLRGKEGEEDARFVADLAEEQGLTLHRRRVDIPALVQEEGGSVEAVARRERYTFLDEARGVAGARWTVTGHSADDQVETFLMNLLRGAGPRGMGGMLPVGPGPMCRPLLSTWRNQIMAFLADQEIPYRVDSTNADVSLTRNRIRQALVPVLESEFGTGVIRTLARGSQLMNDVDDYLSHQAHRVLKEMLVGGEPSEEDLEIRIEIPKLKTHHPVLQRSVIRAAVEDLAGGLQEVTLGHVDAVLNLVHRKEGSGIADLPHGLAARREYDALILGSATGRDDVYSAPEASVPLSLSGPGQIRWGRLQLKWSFAAREEIGPLERFGHPKQSVFDRETLVDPLYLRAVRAGDRVEPSGMEGSQKLSDLLINRKVPRHMRTWVPLLCDNGGPEDGERILWVVGQRRARHAAVEPETSQVVVFEAETIV